METLSAYSSKDYRHRLALFSGFIHSTLLSTIYKFILFFPNIKQSSGKNANLVSEKGHLIMLTICGSGLGKCLNREIISWSCSCVWNISVGISYQLETDAISRTDWAGQAVTAHPHGSCLMYQLQDSSGCQQEFPCNHQRENDKCTDMGYMAL